MSATPTDDLVQAAVARLEGELPALVADAGLPAVTEFLNYDPGAPQVVKAPQVWVDLPEDVDSTDELRGATIHKRSVRNQLLVAVTSAGQDQDSAARALRQMRDLILTVMEGDQTLGGTALWCRYRQTRYSPNMSGNATSLFKECILTFDVNRRRLIGAP